MILLVCSCLNVRVHGKTCDQQDATCLDLPENVSNDPFFESHVYRVPLDLAGVTLSQKMLCKIRKVDDWSITSCVCCKMDIYAKQDGNNDQVLVSPKAEKSSNNITSLMNSEKYSPLFKLILPEINGNFIQNNRGVEFHNRNVDMSIELVQNQVSTFLKEEQKAMEERIRQFTEQQQSMYTNLLQKVRKNKQAMIYLMIQCKESRGHSETESMTESSVEPSAVLNRDAANASSTSTDSAFDRSDASDPPFSEQIKHQNLRSLQRTMSEQPRSKPKAKRFLQHAPNSFDFGGIFDMELEFDSKISLSSNSDGNSDDSDYDLSTDIGDEKPTETSVYASSLPMSIPAFSHASRSLLEDDKDPFPLPSDDIPASMRALACSVNDGTEIFGELPRRRLNTGDLLAFRPR